MLTKPSLGIRDNWRKLYDKVQGHERNTNHLQLYCEWQSLEENLKKDSGIDCCLQKRIEKENEFIEECAKFVTEVIVKQVQAAFYYGIIVDGTPDVSHTEQITFVLSLNLCGVHAAASSMEVKCFFGNIQKLYNLFSSSPARWKILQETAHLSLHKLSDTRWSVRIDTIKPIAKRQIEIVRALQKIKECLDLPAELYSEVEGMLKWMTSFEFIILTTLWSKTLQGINEISQIP
uniref:DUF4371 domain-containing protein n=1 Tax=Amphimedon queenslandica TaxID=400682 RepID=A0A1X7V161_AMPQE